MGLLQLALDFFHGGSTQAAAEPDTVAMPRTQRPPPARAPRLRISRPIAPDAPGLPAVPVVPGSPAAPLLSDLQAGAALLLCATPGDASGAGTSRPLQLPQHPRANREALLADRPVRYAFQRGRRRTIGFSVGPEGLTVRAPGWVPLHQIDAALSYKAEWILRKLADAQTRRGRVAERQVVWGDGACFPFLGETVQVTLCGAAPACAKGRAAAPSALLLPAAADAPAGTHRRLEIALAIDAPAPLVQATVHTWLLARARSHFAARLDHFAAVLEVRWTRLGLTSARTRWGSASSSGAIRLHWRLMHFRPAVVDYVVAHELAHLRHMDHSPRFWSVVAQAVPDHMALRRELRHDSVPRWD